MAPSPHHTRTTGTAPALGAFLLGAVVWTWPLARYLTSRVPHDPGDPLLNIWLVWWNAQAVPFTDRWWSPPIFHPMPGALALSEHLAGIAIITTPLQLAGASALTAYNVALILSFALSGLFAFLLVRSLSGSPLAAACAGLAFGFAPYRAGQLAHLQVLSAQWMPLALFAMHRYTASGRRRWLAVFVGAWLLQSLSNGYYLLFFPVLIALWLAWFIDWRRAPRRGLILVGTWILGTLPLVPMLLRYETVQRGLGLARSTGEMTMFSATAAAFAHPSGMLAFWPFVPAANEELYLYPGLVAILLVVVGWTAGRSRPWRDGSRAPLLFYSGAMVVMWALAAGPAPPDSGARALLHPYTLLTWLPGFDAIRVPARFAMLGALCLAVAAGLALDRIVAVSRHPRTRYGVALLAMTAIALDQWTRPMPLILPPGRVLLPEASRATVVELPPDEGVVNTHAMYRAMQHQRPLVNGYSGHVPPHYAVLWHALRRNDPSALVELARGRPLIIVVHDRIDTGGAMRRLVESLPGIQAHSTSGVGGLFVLPAQASARVPDGGTLLPATVREMPPHYAVIDLRVERVVRTIEFPLRWHTAELERRLAIDGSLDGTTWRVIGEEWTGGAALAGALRDPREIPVRFALPDVSVRYLRIHPAAAWLSRELRVYGPG